jgi:3-isopropylmalate dehydrogenase
MSSLHIAVLPGDGIGVEVTGEALALLRHLAKMDNTLALDFEMIEGGAEHYRSTGVALSEDAMRRAEKADAILFGAMGLPHIRYPDGREIAPQVDLRERFGLYAGVRPVRSIPGLAPVLSDPRAAALDFVLIRESTEGLFAGRLKGGTTDDQRATDLLEVTRTGTERVASFAFRLAASRRQTGAKVTCVDKANILPSMAFFRKIFDEVAARHPGVGADHMYVDAAALNLVRRPWDFDVIVTENMFGDILSDLGAALLGGMGLAPSADIGDRHAVFQPCHGSAPDIMGTGKANPVGMFLSAAMMLEWLADRHDDAACARAAHRIRAAVDRVFASRSVLPIELGGSDTTKDVTAAITRAADASD